MANDKNITLGQLFALDDNVEVSKLLLQWVHDVGDWWSHSICVTKYDECDTGIEIPTDATVAHLLGGKGGSIPEDIGGIERYHQLILQLTGSVPVSEESPSIITTNIDPGCEKWWSLFNEKFRSKMNRSNFISNPANFFDCDRASSNLKKEIYCPRPENILENATSKKWHMESGLACGDAKKCTITLPKKTTDICAYCSVAAALKRCSGKFCLS